jgi:hypothetical protein
MVVGKLRATGYDPSPTGPDAYESRCPAHGGKRKNLSIRAGEDGRILLHCHHAGENGSPSCPVDAIVGALGLRVEDLYPKPNGPTRPKTSPKPKRSWASLDQAAEAIGGVVKATSRTAWLYLDRESRPALAVVRYNTADGKTYRPLHILPDGSWATGDPPGPLPLLNLPFLDGTETVWVFEGEKCCDVASDLGLIASTSAHGSGSAAKSDWSPLAGRKVVIVPDCDVAGEGYCLSVLGLLKALRPRPQVKVVRLPGLADGGDVADWVPKVVGEGKPPLSALQGLADAAPVVDWDTVQDAPQPKTPRVEPQPEIEAPIPIPEWPDPPADAAFHGLAGEVVRLIEPTSEADPVGVLLQFLIGFGNAIGPGLSVLADGHHHHANEYGVTVGDTSRARKGTAWRRVRPILAHTDIAWSDNKITGGLSSGEGLIWEIRDAIPGTDKKTGQPTVLDPGVDDKRLLVVEPEFGNVLRVISRDGNTLSAVLRLGWDSDPLRAMTKNSPARASNPHVSLIGHVTAEELARYLSHVEVFNGLGNRVLWACVRRSKKLAFSGAIEGGSIARLGNRLALALDHARRVGPMDWASSGKATWEGEYDALTESRPGLWGAITSRAEAHVLRLAMIYAALDRADRIADTHVLAALELWRFCDRSAAYLFGGSVGDRDADAILAALRSKPEGMTRTEINVGVFNRHRTSDEIARSLAVLLRHGLARFETTRTDGRPTETWFAVADQRAKAKEAY